LTCQPKLKGCDSSGLKTIQCNADGSKQTVLATCGTGTKCTGLGVCVTKDVFDVSAAANDSSFPVAAQLKNGGFVLAWVSSPSQADEVVKGAIFDATGKAGASFKISDKKAPELGERIAIAASSNGFVVAWVNKDSNTDKDIVVRFYDSAGKALTGEAVANTSKSSDQNQPAVATNANGSVVVWSGENVDLSATGIGMQRYDSKGKAAGSEVVVNKAANDKDTSEDGGETQPAVALRSDGAIAVAWTEKPQSSEDLLIFGRMFDATGKPTTVNVQLSDKGSERKTAPALSFVGNTLVAAWVFKDFLQEEDIRVTRFDDKLKALAPPALVNTITKGKQLRPSVSTTSTGTTTIVWVTDNAAGGSSGLDMSSRELLASGVLSPAGKETVVSVSASGEQDQGDVIAFDDERILVTWRFRKTDVDDGLIQALFR